jgi:hypothetical protein
MTYSCDMCNQKFNSERELQEHQDSSHAANQQGQDQDGQWHGGDEQKIA